jgi:copper resistance protein D
MRTAQLIALITVILRAATLVFQSLLVGGIVFHRWIAAGAFTREPGFGIRLLRSSAIALAVTQALYLGLNTMILKESLGLSLAETVGANFFVAGMLTIGAALAISTRPSLRLAHPGNPVMLLSLVVLACGVLASHAASRIEQRALLITCTAVHQCATAVWIGGLPQLWISLRAPDSGRHAEIARRFSRLAMIAVVALCASGVTMAVHYIDSPAAMYGTSYGIMVAVKILFFLVLISIGALNRRLVRSLSRSRDPHETELPARPGAARQRMLLRRLLEAEIGIGITAILAAASLTSQPPAADLSIGRVTGTEIYERMKPSWPRLSSSKLTEISASSTQARKRARAAGLPLPPAHANTSGDIAWSEYNHHWAGIFVLVLGLLAAAQRVHLQRARYWPLLLAGLAVFIFLRADPEGWPLGPDSLWENIQNPENLQHKISALLILLFAAFELRVQLGKARAIAAYVFPAVCAIGGALLLTHSHSLDNMKEQLLAELSHAPIAIAAVFAGWSRWLELRLPENHAGWMTRVWPACFIVIGGILLNYREA